MFNVLAYGLSSWFFPCTLEKCVFYSCWVKCYINVTLFIWIDGTIQVFCVYNYFLSPWSVSYCHYHNDFFYISFQLFQCLFNVFEVVSWLQLFIFPLPLHLPLSFLCLLTPNLQFQTEPRAWTCEPNTLQLTGFIM